MNERAQEPPHPWRSFHLGWMLGFAPLAAVAFDIAVPENGVVPALALWLWVFPVLGIAASIAWRDGRSARVLVLAVTPSVLGLLTSATLLGFANA